MAAKKQSKASLTSAQKAGIGVGLTAAAVAAAGAYFLTGTPDAKKNRQKVKSWMLKAKADVLGVIEEAEHMTEDEYKHLVETATKTYGKVKDASKGDVTAFKKEMLAHWPAIVAEGKVVADAVSKVAKNAQKKAKKATKKTATPKKKAAPKKKASAKKPAAKKAPAKKKAAPKK